MPYISVVSPVYRAEDCVEELCRRLKLVLGQISNDFEIILVEDRGPDNSWVIIQEQCRKDPRIRGIRLAKNFGQHRAITAGLDVANGDWVIVMDCDLQDPPEEILNLYNKVRQGYEIVVAQFDERAESTLRQVISKTFWTFLSWVSGIPFDYRIGNFRIMSRRVVENFRKYREQLRLLGGITALMGFTSTVLPVKRDERYAGKTSYNIRKLLLIAVDIAVAYSDKPLKISIIFGLTISLASFLTGAVILFFVVWGGTKVPGWTSIIFSLFLIGGLIIANLGIVGYYIGKVFDETKQRPLYIIESTTEDTEIIPQEPEKQREGEVIWITGLSGSGKSTLALEVVKKLRVEGRSVILLDGDELRDVFGTFAVSDSSYEREGRLGLAIRYARMCRVIALQGFTVVIATISLFREIHKWNRQNLPGYFEVYLNVPIEELRRRDPKNIYQRFDKGELTQVAGLDLSVDEPEAADWVVNFPAPMSLPDTATAIVERVLSREW